MRIVCKRSLVLCGVVLLGTVLYSQHKPKEQKVLLLGVRVPMWEFVDATNQLRDLASLLGGHPGLVVLLPFAEPDCERRERELQQTAKQLGAIGWTLIAATTGVSSSCSPQVGFRLPGALSGLRAPAILILDRERVLRRIVRNPRQPVTPEALADEVRFWLDGMASFKSQCARCHGEDGRDTSYPGTKSLAGIGNRHSEAEILDMTQTAGFVDLSYLKEEGKRALAAFVAGL